MTTPFHHRLHRSLRLPLMLGPAAVLTMLLFLMMGRMVANNAHAVVSHPPPPQIFLGEAQYQEVSPPERPPLPDEPQRVERPEKLIDSSQSPTTAPQIPIDPVFTPDGPAMPGGPEHRGGSPILQSRPDSTPFPPYPDGARRSGVEGHVIVEMTIDSRGRVVAARILSSKPARVFDSATLRAVQRWSLPSTAPEQGQITVRRRLDFRLTQ